MTYSNELNHLEQENESISNKKLILVKELETIVLGTQ